MTRAPRRVHPGLVALVVALTAWVGCAVVVEVGPLSSTVDGPVTHAADGLILPHLQDVPVTGSAPVLVAPPAVTPKPAHHVSTPKPSGTTAAPVRSVTVAPPVAPVVVHHPTVTHHKAPTRAKPQPLQVGVDIPDTTTTTATVPVTTVVVIPPVTPTSDGSTTTTTPVSSTGPTGPVAAGTDPGSGIQAAPLPPVDSTVPETPIPTPSAPPTSDSPPPPPSAPVASSDPGTTTPTPPPPPDTATGTPVATPSAVPPG